LSVALAAGEGLRATGTDIRAGTTWRAAGGRLDARDLPLLAALGVADVLVRAPRVAVLATGRPPGRGVADGIGPALLALLAAEGALAVARPAVAGERAAIAAALPAAAAAGDLVVVTGGSGEGDHAAAALADAGACRVHGIGVRPGGSAGFGVVDGTPVLLLPGSPAEAFGAWLAVGRMAVRRLAGATAPPRRRVRLARKLVSVPGLAELALLRWTEDGDATPAAATGELTLGAFAAADAYMIVPGGAEGYENGAAVDCLII
jgi:molybdopterin biosynthesis enzyme